MMMMMMKSLCFYTPQKHQRYKGIKTNAGFVCEISGVGANKHFSLKIKKKTFFFKETGAEMIKLNKLQNLVVKMTILLYYYYF